MPRKQKVRFHRGDKRPGVLEKKLTNAPPRWSYFCLLSRRKKSATLVAQTRSRQAMASPVASANAWERRLFPEKSLCHPLRMVYWRRGLNVVARRVASAVYLATTVRSNKVYVVECPVSLPKVCPMFSSLVDARPH